MNGEVGALAALLAEAEAAHGIYETRDLGGTFDEAWPRWYAEYLVEHGVGEIAVGLAAIDKLTTALAECDEAYRRDAADEDWALYYARRMLGNGFRPDGDRHSKDVRFGDK